MVDMHDVLYVRTGKNSLEYGARSHRLWYSKHRGRCKSVAAVPRFSGGWGAFSTSRADSFVFFSKKWKSNE